MWNGARIKINLPDNYKEIVDIWIASKCGQLHDVAAILKKNPELLQKQDYHNNTPLYYACLYGHGHVAEYLLQQGARDDAFARCYINSLVSKKINNKIFFTPTNMAIRHKQFVICWYFITSTIQTLPAPL